MARITLDMPENYLYSTDLTIRISDINHGNHLGNDRVLSLANEARARFFKRYNYSELNVEGLALIISDAAIVYKAEGFYGDQIRIDVTIQDFNRYGFDILYLISNSNNNTEIAHLKTGVVFFDYQAKKVQAVPEAFRSKMESLIKNIAS